MAAKSASLMEVASQSPQGRIMEVVDLPVDVLRIICKKLDLKDRMHLELLNKKHRDTLRQPELWTQVDLAAMQALNLTEGQFLHLLSKVDPDLHRYSRLIKEMCDSWHMVKINQPVITDKSRKVHLGLWT